MWWTGTKLAGAVHKVWLVTRHEFLVAVSRPSYKIIAAIVPAVGLAALIGVGLYLAISDPGPATTTTAGFVDLSG